MGLAFLVMELDDVLTRRHMTRHFETRAIPTDVLERVLAAGLRAPSAGFSQGLDLIVLRDVDSRRRFFGAVADEIWMTAQEGTDGLVAAPVIVVPVADPTTYATRYREDDKAGSSLHGRTPDEWPTPYWTVDASFAAMLILLKATDEGLGALFFQLQGNDAAVCRAIGAPERSVLIGAVALGYGKTGPESSSATYRRRRRFDQVVRYGRF